MTFDTLRASRKKARIGLRELARHLVMSPQYLSDLETGKRGSQNAITRAAAGLREMVKARKAGGK